MARASPGGAEKALLMEPSAFAYAERHDNIEAIYKKLQDKCDSEAARKSARGKTRNPDVGLDAASDNTRAGPVFRRRHLQPTFLHGHLPFEEARK